jgi:prepilin signal peptidase PulO-like enzyme (type II secretory pathway)
MGVTTWLVIEQLRPQRWLRRGLWAGVVALVVVVVPAGAIGVGFALVAYFLWDGVVEDLRTQRIPNSAIMFAAAALVYLGVIAVGFERVAPADVLGGAAWGLLLSGAVALALVWLVAPHLIGGGDVKLLAVQAAALGVVDPRAAFVCGTVAVIVQLVASAVLRRRHLPFAPALYAGFAVGVLSTIWLHTNLEVVT